MISNVEDTTQMFRKALNILFVSNAQGTSLGVAVAIVTHGLMSFFMPTLKTIAGVDFEIFRFWHHIAFWVVAFNIKPYLNRHKPDPKIEAAINQIEDMVAKGQISKAQAKLKYYELSQRVVESVTLSQKDDSSEPAQQ
ncbi:TPA: hypothetical protein ACX3CW_002262 [Vibrio parahaemolyticus]|uniref:hypothetical protein n=1 Tax=Vibrio parahaemolyticus TaxID=670 RepID=UPI003B670473|nr:hypothetical protein [Vibrio parahaemolyticus]HCE3427214.1 hypothetical protein [Vibrio parahaemolyticus]HCG9212702.1 hypothetical protein [Vibrio parahaemolyticus]HCM1217665.1 hypothetical protein [Vibrio parahaemolyticus]